MSLILDALKRAEQERKLGQPPEAGQITTMSPIASSGHSRDRSLIIVMALLLLAAAIVIAALLMHSGSNPATDMSATAIRVPPQAMQPITAPPPAQAVTRPASAAIVDRGSVNSMDDVVAADDGEAENAQAARVAEGNLPSAAANPAARPAFPKNPKAPPSPEVKVSGDSPAAVVEDNNAGETTEESAAPSSPAAPSLRDMPEPYRDAFPQLTIDVHVYNDNPEHRFIIVGGNTYHEGSNLPQGPQILAITADGVVFEWQGQRVLYALGSN